MTQECVRWNGDDTASYEVMCGYIGDTGCWVLVKKMVMEICGTESERKRLNESRVCTVEW
jgi:hypothetical protein